MPSAGLILLWAISDSMITGIIGVQRILNEFNSSLTQGATFSGGQFLANSVQYRFQSLLALVVLSRSIISALERLHQAPWSVSNLVSNITRRRLAEYIVAKACDIPTNAIRDEWQAFDLITKDDIKIEVKSAAYLQSSPQLSIPLAIIHQNQSFD